MDDCKVIAITNHGHEWNVLISTRSYGSKCPYCSGIELLKGFNDLFVVPNHLTEQWASEYLQLYPSANILVATKKDFETKNRKKFCGRIATGDYDAIIIGHSQFEKIPMSTERQIAMLEQQECILLIFIHLLLNSNHKKVNITQKTGTA